MARKILLALDESNDSLKALKYVAENMPLDSEVTLLSILPDPTAACDLDAPSLVPLFKENQQAFCAMEDAKRERVQAFVEKAREGLIRSGFGPQNVNAKILKKEKDIAKEIVQEARDGGIDTVVVGRRGLTGVKEFLFGSVSNKVLHLATGMAVVVVD